MKLFVGAVADDDTGATDLGNMLSMEGMRVAVVTFGNEDGVRAAAEECDAVVVGTASRSIAKEVCYARTRAAVLQLRAAGAKRLLIKYCSTFDSTPEGNIGAMIDAAMDAMECSFTLALPAQPSLGRTTYMGYHFVGRQLLSDSPMRHHPLTPMTNPNLLSHLGTQTERKIGLLPFAVVQSAANEVRAEMKALEDSVGIAVCDCVDDEQLHTLGEVAAAMPLLTGSSAWGTALPRVWKARGEWMPKPATRLTRNEGGSGILCVSGSCSAATAGQIAWAREHGWHVFDLDAAQLAQGVSSVPAPEIVEALREGKRVLLTTQQDLRNTSTPPSDLGSSAVSRGERIASGLAEFVRTVFDQQQPAGLIVAGGETSSTLVRELRLGGVRIGETIDRGVPLCVALNVPSLALALKSGNFGEQDFFGRAADAIGAMPTNQRGEA